MKHLLLILCLALIAPLLAANSQRGARKASPFDGMRWQAGQPEVLVEGTWYRPVSIQGTPVHDILEYCEKRWPGKTEKRFREDLVEAMEGMGIALPARVGLVLEGLADGERITLQDVLMSADKRNALRDAARRERPKRALPPALLTRDQALDDIAEFQVRLEDQFAYLHWKGIDLSGEIEDLTEELGEEVQNKNLADRLHRLLMLFGDGHARVSSQHAPRPDRYPPVLLAEAEGGVVAFAPDRSGFLDPQRPFVVTIDGHSIDEWIEWVSPWIVAGSEQTIRARALGRLRELVLWRERFGHPASNGVVFELASKPGAKQGKDLEVKLVSRRPTFGSWPNAETRQLKGKIGYLRLERMDDDRIGDLRRAMNEFRDTKGLVVDVRGNGGGSRGLLVALAGYLVGPDEDPWVGNVAAYRASERFAEDHLEARLMARAGDARWNVAQGEAIESLVANFEPEWNPGEGFSDWHYLVLDRTGDPDEYFYDRPVVILCDALCFSATDIFLGALSGRPRITLMGSASGGGSARSQGFTLSNSKIEVRCASMASFRPDGRLYDGRGVEVDLEVLPKAEDLLDKGKDHQLKAALKHLGRR